MGVELDELVAGDSPEAWRAAGFTVDDDGTCRIGRVRVRLEGDGKYLRSWSLRGVDAGVADVDGFPTSVTTRDACTPADHANGATLIDHVVLLSPDVDRTVAALAAIGVEAKRTREVDAAQYGFPARQVFFTLGEPILELIGGHEPMGDGPVRMFGLAYTVDDIDALPGRYGEHLGVVKDAVQPGRRITTLRHKALGMSIATAFMSP